MELNKKEELSKKLIVNEKGGLVGKLNFDDSKIKQESSYTEKKDYGHYIM